ncbi:MAG TPA: glycoside hydrolase family 2 TIM barrel-domain containing protein [Verrucomicrobiae bacterium]|nr:glycoside hydrolase family 2 TIM barrel-domain containing protein [Verrucomicrobiae bacterium]
MLRAMLLPRKWINRPSIVLAGCAAVMGVFAAQGEQTVFHRAFAPQDGLVSRYEEPVRREMCLNGSWKFAGDTNTGLPEEFAGLTGAWDKTAIRIPSPWNVNSFSMTSEVKGGDFRAFPSYPKEWDNLSAAWMERTIDVPEDWKGKRILLNFGAVAGKFAAYVNGKRAGEGFDIFFAQEFDVTDLIRPGQENRITVKVISPKVFDKKGRYGRREYLSGSFWGTHIAGIWQDVFLLAEPQVAVKDVFVQSWVDRDEIDAEVSVGNESAKPMTVDISATVLPWINLTGNSVEEAPEVKWKLGDQAVLNLPGKGFTLAAGETRTIVLTAKVNGRLKLWSADEPNLYGMLVNVSAEGRQLDVKYQRFGWRQFKLDGSRLLLNGEPIVLRGDSWHFLGIPQMTRRYAYAWFRLLKDAGANAVRLHASVYPAFYHDMADEMGIMILDESAIWLSDGGPKADSDLFWANCRKHVAELVRRDRNHPSVFGWSICNEALPVLRNVWHTPQSMIDHCLDEMAAWAEICRTNDPTHGWISGDGEFDASGRLPVVNIHYGGEREMKRAAASGKPWGVGETSMAYYGTPKQVSKFNGNRAYESMLGRMEGLAYECYGLLRSQQTNGASYQSVFNIVWYGVQPLPIGKRDTAQPISLNEGIFFDAYREGVPGVQPERIGPYCTTLNPGYDPALPLYRPWPMFEAIRDANLGNTNSPWRKAPVPMSVVPVSTAGTNGIVAYAVHDAERLAWEMTHAGIHAQAYSRETNATILLVDASGLTDRAAVDDVLDGGGSVWIWNITPATARGLKEMFGWDVGVERRVSSSFVVGEPDPLMAGVGNDALYFCEEDDWRQSSFGLVGKSEKIGEILLKSCPADWRQWNYKPEPVKTAAILRSELERTNARAVVVARAVRNGRVVLFTLRPDITSNRKRDLIECLFRNAGVEPGAVAAQNDFVDPSGRLVRALVCGSFGFDDVKEAYSGRMPSGEIKPGAHVDRRRWTLGQANSAGEFDFRNGMITGPQENAVAYLAVWIKSPKPLNDLLSEPNLPRLAFTYGADDGCELFLNGERLATQQREGPIDPKMFSQNPLLLKLGWNQLVIKVVQLTGEWKFAGQFSCNDQTFLDKLEFSAEKPE